MNTFFFFQSSNKIRYHLFSERLEKKKRINDLVQMFFDNNHLPWTGGGIKFEGLGSNSDTLD